MLSKLLSLLPALLYAVQKTLFFYRALVSLGTLVLVDAQRLQEDPMILKLLGGE